MAVKLLPVIPAEMVLARVGPANPVTTASTERRLRASSYTIYVDLPNNSHEMLLVHGYTGAFDRVSGTVATYMRSLELKRPIRPLYGQWTPEPEIAPGTVAAPSAATIAILKRRGYLTELTLQEEEDRLAGIATTLHKQQSRLPNYIFMPTYDCNLRCFYCFQDHMRTDPTFKHLLRTMNVAMIDRIFEGIPKLEGLHGLAPGEINRRSIGFFGGEPLLRQNRPAIEYIMRKAEAIGQASFWAVSNATDLDAYSDLLGPGKIARVQITLDGTPEEHDQRRIYADGSGSYQRIARNITMALELGACYGVRRMRVPREEYRLALAFDRQHAGTKAVQTLLFGPLATWMKRQLRAHGFVWAERVYGNLHSGRMDEAYFLYMLEHLRARTNEIYFHPAVYPVDHPLKANEWQGTREFAALTSHAVCRRLHELGIALINYFDLDPSA